MQILINTKFDFMAKRKLAIMFSLLLIIVSIGSLATRGLNFGLDFTGGTLIEVGYKNSAELTSVRNVLGNAGFNDATIQHFGSSKEVLIRVAPREGLNSAKISNQVLQALKTADDTVIMRRQEFVGPQVGSELRDDGGTAMIFALFLILIYVMFRFQWRFAVGAVTALIHDVLITVGMFSIFQFEFDLTVLAAVLAVIGYSLNDTIVVFDRIRENFRRLRKVTATDVINTSLNQTLSRTIITSITTALVVLAMFFFGGELLHAFSIALLFGILIGTYSSIYVASTMALILKVSHADVQKVATEGADQEQQIL